MLDGVGDALRPTWPIWNDVGDRSQHPVRRRILMQRDATSGGIRIAESPLQLRDDPRPVCPQFRPSRKATLYPCATDAPPCIDRGSLPFPVSTSIGTTGTCPTFAECPWFREVDDAHAKYGRSPMEAGERGAQWASEEAAEPSPVRGSCIGGYGRGDSRKVRCGCQHPRALFDHAAYGCARRWLGSLRPDSGVWSARVARRGHAVEGCGNPGGFSASR